MEESMDFVRRNKEVRTVILKSEVKGVFCAGENNCTI